MEAYKILIRKESRDSYDASLLNRMENVRTTDINSYYQFYK